MASDPTPGWENVTDWALRMRVRAIGEIQQEGLDHRRSDWLRGRLSLLEELAQLPREMRLEAEREIESSV